MHTLCAACHVHHLHPPAHPLTSELERREQELDESLAFSQDSAMEHERNAAAHVEVIDQLQKEKHDMTDELEGVYGEVEKHKNEAEEHKKIAEQHRADAELHKESAERHEADARIYKESANQFKDEVEKHKDEVEKHKLEAEKHKLEAEKHRQDAEFHKDQQKVCFGSVFHVALPDLRFLLPYCDGLLPMA